jgi:hypothetical protein
MKAGFFGGFGRHGMVRARRATSRGLALRARRAVPEEGVGGRAVFVGVFATGGWVGLCRGARSGGWVWLGSELRWCMEEWIGLSPLCAGLSASLAFSFSRVPCSILRFWFLSSAACWPRGRKIYRERPTYYAQK